jgi:hypothetical protein
MAGAAEVRHMMIGAARAMQLCKRIRQNMTDARNDLLELYEGEGWRSLGYASWRGCVTTEFGEHQSTLYRQLEAAQVARELDADPVFAHVRKTKDVPDRQLRALGGAEVGTRAEVYKIATEAAEGKPTEAVVKAAVEAKKADPDATPAELVKAVVAARPKPPRAVVPEAVEDVREERAERAAIIAEISDDEWIAAMPLADQLEGHALDKFRRDALDYRDFEATTRASVRGCLDRSKRRSGRHKSFGGVVGYRLMTLAKVQHPKVWDRCPALDKGGCGGAGTVGMIGECPLCRGRGYIAR